MSKGKIRLGIVGVGNCASALVQGIEFYKDARPGEDRADQIRHDHPPSRRSTSPSPSRRRTSDSSSAS